MGKYFSQHYKNITYPVDSAVCRGLRNAQLGAIHAIASFFTLNLNQASIVVMPTGAGKTAVLMLAPYLLSKDKVLVVTPSTMVRGQIAEDFEKLLTLCKANVFNETMKKPCVFEMQHKYDDVMVPELDTADVIVATPQCALSLSESAWAVRNITLVEVDEAHHTPAKTWQQILINLKAATHVLFTATPFRLDRKEIVGDIVYDYPLSKAYSDGIFGEIQYVPVLGGENRDLNIARKAEEVLLADREEELQHYLMVRTDTKSNAVALEDLYAKYTSLKLRRIDSSMSNSIIKRYIQELKDGSLDGIICVDMLGEGFDFPNLKIAAIHAPHKSMASTLQFIGRFARTNAESIGKAKFVAANDDELMIENNRLYASNAIWQEMIINMSEGKNEKELEERKYYKAYEGVTISTIEDYIPLQAITLNCHDRIYRVESFDITAEFPENYNVGNRVYRNRKDQTIVGIGLEYLSPLWMSGEFRINKEYHLFVLHYQERLGLLHIYSQSHTEIIYDELAETFCSKYEKIPKSEMNRVLGDLSNFEIFNSGMLNRFNESGEAYRIMAGSDVSSAIDPSTGKMYSAGHVFCKASDQSGGTEESITIGYSSASKVWSSSYKNLPEYILWVEQIGKKISNSTIRVKTNTNYDYIPMAEKLDRYPDNIFFADYSDDTYSSPPVIKSRTDAGISRRLTDFSLRIKDIKQDRVMFILDIDGHFQQFTCDLKGKYTSEKVDFFTHIGQTEQCMTEFFTNNPLSFKTLDDALITGFEIYRGLPDTISFDQSSIASFDWRSYGTDTSVEFKRSAADRTISIHDTLRDVLMQDKDNKYILFDHGSGEIADFIAIKEDEYRMIVRLYHVKSKSATGFNSSMSDVYEVAGQAVKSLIWLTTKGKLIDKISGRHASGYSQLINGDYTDFIKELRSSAKQLTAFVVIVQPSLSKTVPMPDKMQEVLAAAASYISRAGKVQGLEIIGSEQQLIYASIHDSPFQSAPTPDCIKNVSIFQRSMRD